MDALRHHRPGMLRELVPETDNLEERGNSVYATYRYKVPVNEFSIPKRDALIYGAIEAAHGKLNWDGVYDDHHLAWPKNYYQSIVTDTDDALGRRYRALRSLRFFGPRQLHEYLHVGFTVPETPDSDVMVQYMVEEEQQRGLYALLQFSPEEREACVINAQSEIGRRARYLARIETMKPSQLGHLQDLNHLASLNIDQARLEIGKRIRYLSFRDVLATFSQ